MEIFKTPVLPLFGVLFFLTSCSGSADLQNYFVEKSDNPDFNSIVVPASTLSSYLEYGDETLNDSGLKSINVLFFRVKENNKEKYTQELKSVRNILKHPDFKELMKFNLGRAKAEIKYLGENETASEVLFLASDSEQGFILIRIAGKQINPVKLVPVFQQIQSESLEKFISFNTSN
jgi:hypothetical protein